MPRTAKEFKKIRTEKEREIVEKATNLFAIQGYNQITMEDISKKVGGSHGLIYHYFENKAQILYRISTKVKDLLPVMNQNDHGLNAIRKILTYWLEIMNATTSVKLYYFRIFVCQNISNSTTELPQKVKRDYFETILKNYIIQGQEEGDVANTNPQELVNCIIALFESFSYEKLTLKKGEDYPLPPVDIILGILEKKTVFVV